jgi:hypothetical protein
MACGSRRTPRGHLGVEATNIMIDDRIVPVVAE